jgi:hypothetical protein
MLESDYPGRTLAVIPLGGRLDIPTGAAAGPDPDYLFRSIFTRGYTSFVDTEVDKPLH